MPRIKVLPLLALATLSATAALAQDSVTPGNSNYTTQSEAAPIERGPATNYYSPDRPARPMRAIAATQPGPGVFLRVEPRGSAETVSSDAHHVELRVTRGRANVNVHDPSPDTLVLVDLPGGQTQLLKNGLYTFNADTNTVRVLKGEASAFPGQSTNPVKVKEFHQVVFGSGKVRSIEVDPYLASADLLPGAHVDRSDGGYGGEFYGGGPYGYGFYGDGYPYYAYGDPYGFYGYPYGYGYPFGFGFGYYGGFGGFRGGGFRGGFGGRGGGHR
jgi:hypothetical protein